MTTSPQSWFTGLEKWLEPGRGRMQAGYTKLKQKSVKKEYLYLSSIGPVFLAGAEAKPFPFCCREIDVMVFFLSLLRCIRSACV